MTTASLFRAEAYHARRVGGLGAAILVNPLSSWMLIGFLIAILAVAVCLAAVTSYSRIEMAAGVITPKVPAVKVVAPRSGTLVALNVTEGSVVEKGQTLAVVQVEQADALGGSPAARDVTALDLQAGLAQAQIDFHKKRSDSELERLSVAAEGLAAELRRVEQQIELQRELVTNANASLDRLQAAKENGVISKLDYDSRREAALSHEQKLRSLEQQTASIAAQRAQLRRQSEQAPYDEESELARLQSEVSRLIRERDAAGGERSYAIVASISGRVTGLQTGQGRYVDQRLPLMSIVPDGGRLQVEVFAPSRAIGLVQPGQQVRLAYDAFPYERFGSFGGRIASISSIVLAANEVDAAVELKEPAFRITIELENEAVEIHGQRYFLRPGMAVLATIVLERRTLLQRMLGPFLTVAEHA